MMSKERSSRRRSGSKERRLDGGGGKPDAAMTTFPTARVDKTSLHVTLPPGTNLHVRNGAMLWMDDGIDATVRVTGFLSRFFSDNDLLFTEFANKEGDKPLRLVIGSSLPCEIIEVEIQPGQTFVAHAGSFLACTGNVAQGGRLSFKGLVLGSGVVMAKYTVDAKAAKPGKIWLTAFGGVHTMDVRPGQTLRIDTGLFLCAPEAVVQTWQFGKIGSLLGAAFNGEGLVFKVHGGEKGQRIHLHSQNFGDLAKALVPYLVPYLGAYFQPRK